MKISALLASAVALAAIGTAALADDYGHDHNQNASNNVTINGSVNPLCTLTGSSATINLIGLGPNTTLQGSTNVGTGFCNTSNTVTVSKTNGTRGLVDNSSITFDQGKFTNALPYSVTASWQGVSLSGQGGKGPSAQSLTVDTGHSQNSTQQGAWNSQIALNVTVPQQSQDLLAGTYSDTVTVTLATF